MPTLEVLPLAGAFPQLNPVTGEACVQTEGFWELKFLDATRSVWQDGTAVRIGIPPNGVVAYGRGVPRLAAGNGSFAVTLQPGIVMNGTLELDPQGGITRLAHNWISPEGDVLWTTPFHADIKDVKHRAPNGVVRTVGTFRNAESVRMSSGLLTFKGDGITWWAIQEGDGYRVQRVVSVGEATEAPVPLRTAEGYWVLEQYATRGGYCLHPVDSVQGHRISGIDTFNTDAVVINGEIWVVSQQRVGGPVELRKFNLAEPRVDLTARPELPAIAPNRPFFVGAFHHHTLPRANWGTLEVPSTLDVVSDAIAPARPSLIGPDAIAHAPVDKKLVQGLLVTLEGGSPQQVSAAVEIVRQTWVGAHGWPVPPVFVYLTEDQRAHFGAGFKSCDVDGWVPECYWPLAFPADAEDAFGEELVSWYAALGTEHPWLLAVQAFDRNGAHEPFMGEVTRLQPLFLNDGAAVPHIRGVLFFDANRSGFVKYPALRAQFERIAAVCSPPQELAPWREEPIDPPPGPLGVTFVYSPSAVQAETGKSVPVRAVATITGKADFITWVYAKGPNGKGVVDAKNPASDLDHTFRFFEPGTYYLAAIVENANGIATAGQNDTHPVVITPKEGPALPSIEELSLDILRAADWLTYEVYNTDPANHPPTAGRLIDREIDWTGYKQWLLHNYMRAYRIDRGFDHGTALTYVWGDIYHVLNGEYPPTDPRRHSPPPPPPPPPGEGRLIQGALRIESGAFRDDAGFVLPLFVHAGDLFSRYCRGHEAYVNETLDLFRHAGYQGARVWTVLHGPYWRGREVGPTHTSGYWDRLAEFLHKFRERGLRLVLSQGDLWRESDAFAFADRLRDHLDPLAVAFVDAGNETWQNGQDDPRQLARFVERLHTPVLKTLSSPDEDHMWEDVDAWAQDPADCHDAHSGFHDPWGNWRRIWNRGYEGAPKRVGIQSEPRGPGRNVTVYTPSDPGELVAMAINAFLSRQAYVYFSSPGVISDGTKDGHFDNGERYEDQPGFFDVPREVATLPSDVMAWPELFHGGRSQGDRRIFGVTDDPGPREMRCDHTKRGDGPWLCAVYGPNMRDFEHLRGQIQNERPYHRNYTLYQGVE